MAALSACGTDGGRSRSRLTPREFALVPADAAPAPANETLSISASDVTGPVAATEGILDVVAKPGAPAAAASDPRGVEAPELVEATVGAINGKPVYASSFLVDLWDTFRTQAEQVAGKPDARELWRDAAAKTIGAKLGGMIRDEVLRAEAVASIPLEQKPGLFAMMQRVQREEVSKAGGSLEAARRRISEAEGKSFDEYMRQREQTELINYELRRKIARNVNITWRDIKLSYEKNWDRWNPPPRAIFRMVQIPATEESDLREFEARLAGGESFESLARSRLNRSDRDSGGLRSLSFTDRATADFFASPALNEPARTLEAGRWTGPIGVGPMKAWLSLERIDRTATPLYDAQRPIYKSLFESDFNAKIDRYIKRLADRATMTNPDEMAERLLNIAQERYFPTRVR